MALTLNFAPVADLGLTYGRSYSTNPDEVVRYAGAVGKAYDEAACGIPINTSPALARLT